MPVLTHEITEAETGRTVKSIALKEMRLSRGRFSSLKFRNGVLLDGKPPMPTSGSGPGRSCRSGSAARRRFQRTARCLWSTRIRT